MKLVLLFSYFFLPVMLFLGIAVQSIGLYLFALIIPLIYLYKYSINAVSINVAKKNIFIFSVIWLVFPITNIINYLMVDNKDLLLTNLKIGKLFVSNFNSATIISSLILLIFLIFKTKKKNVQQLDTEDISLKILLSFIKGLCFASLLIIIYSFFQHYYGFEYRNASRILDVEHLMSDKTYRIFGFYGHPLTMGAVNLAIFSFSFYIFLESIKNKILKKASIFSFSYDILLFIIVIVNFCLLLWTGGRAPIAVALIMFLSISVFQVLYNIKKLLHNKWFILLSMIGLLLFVIGIIFLYNNFYLFNQVGLINRYKELFDVKLSIEQPNSLNRLIFWRVHFNIFLQNPIFGAGATLLDAGLRTNYYDIMGYVNLRDKFFAHSMLLEILASSGLFGLITIIVAIIYLFKTFLKYCINFPIIYKAFIIAVCANLLHGLVQNTFFDSSVFYWYLCFIYLIYVIETISKKENLC